jgi:hypothetical protein
LGRKRNVQLGYHAVGSFANMRAVNFGVGRFVVGRIGRLAAAAGPAVVWWDGGDPFTTAGAVASMQVILVPVKEIGLDIELWGNLNPERSVAESALCSCSREIRRLTFQWAERLEIQRALT